MFKRLCILLQILVLYGYTSFVLAIESKPTILQVTEKLITVNGKQSKVFAINQPDGTFGYYGVKGQIFDVIVENKTNEPLVLHWHGIELPNEEDGVPFVTQLPIKPQQQYHYKFKLKQAGTFWLHSHFQFQEQKLMAAPLIIYDSNAKKEAEALMFIQDFTFKNPKEIYADLRDKLKNQSSRKMMNMSTDQKPDVADVAFDAFLTNHRTLRDPDVIEVKPLQTLRLRIINASASSNYFINLGKLSGELIAVDGSDIKPLKGSRFQIAIGNRLDIRVKIPQGEGAYPILALPEGTRMQTGLILKTKNAKIPQLSENTESENEILNYKQEQILKPLYSDSEPFRPITRTLVYNLEGNMQNYVWTLNGEVWPYVTPLKIKSGDEVELVFINKTMMPHPMHFHGHVFKVTEVNGKKIDGRLGDTIDVMPNSSMKVVFQADNPGIWMLHCHVLYHQSGGMMTTINYEGYKDRFTEKQRAEEMNL